MTNDHTTSVFRRSPGREDRYVPEIVRFVHTWRSAAQDTAVSMSERTARNQLEGVSNAEEIA